jgi:flavin-dependent dehydrogenase
MFDSQHYPGFFAWIIPTAQGTGKVGVAGRGINAANALQSYLNDKGKNYSIVRKVYAPIWVNGPIRNFVVGHTLIVGDAAGQSKPTTAGGIYTCGMGGLLAGQAIIQAIKKNDDKILTQYEKRWLDEFEVEFNKMLLIRRLLERLDNKAIDELFAAIPQHKLEEIATSGDFDFHSVAVGKILNTPSAVRMVKAFFGNELRRLIND